MGWIVDVFVLVVPPAFAISINTILFALESGVSVSNRLKEGVLSLLMTVVLGGILVLLISKYLGLRALARERRQIVVGDENV